MTLHPEEMSMVQKLDSDSKQDYFDVIIVGSGPGGMSAALCASRAKLSVLIIDRNLPGGQTATAYNISNYLGFPTGILGSDLSIKMEEKLKEPVREDCVFLNHGLDKCEQYMETIKDL